MRTILLAGIGVLLLAGCGTGNFTPYEGAQQSWPTAAGGIVNRKYRVPIYYGPPPRPYIVLGELSAEEEGRFRWSDPESDALEEAARQASKLHADAVVLMNQESGTAGYQSGGLATIQGRVAIASGWSRAVPSSKARVMVIKWR